jgi:hypothetical protein
VAKKTRKDTGGPAPPSKRVLKGWGGNNGPRPNSVSEMTPAQVALLGETLRLQNGDAVNKCRLMFGLVVALPEHDSLYARLRGEGNAFKCEECEKWLPMSEAAEFFPTADPEDVCQSCSDAEDDPDEGAEADRMCR